MHKNSFRIVSAVNCFFTKFTNPINIINRKMIFGAYTGIASEIYNQIIFGQLT